MTKEELKTIKRLCFNLGAGLSEKTIKEGTQAIVDFIQQNYISKEEVKGDLDILIHNYKVWFRNIDENMAKEPLRTPLTKLENLWYKYTHKRRKQFE